MNYINDNHYKSMTWYELLGFDNNERSKRRQQGKLWTAEEIEKQYQNCLSVLNRNNLSEINFFYKKQLPYYNKEFENLSELKEKVQLAYHTLINPEQRKEYDLEVFGIFYYNYPADEVADENFKLKAIKLLEEFLQDELDKDLGHSYWVNYLSGYWQNWRETVENTKYKEEIRFFVHRFHELRMSILKITCWGKERDQKYVPKNASELIEQQKIRLQNISKEEWDKEIEKNKMSEEDIEWVASEVKKVCEGKTTNSQPPNSEELNKLKKWMEESDIEEIILEGRNKVLCKRINDGGSLSFGGDFESFSSEELPEIPEGARTKINGVDIGRFFEKIGKNSISRQELGLDKQEKAGIKNKNNSSWTPWLTTGTLIVSVGIFVWLAFWQKQRRKRIKNKN